METLTPKLRDYEVELVSTHLKSPVVVEVVVRAEDICQALAMGETAAKQMLRFPKYRVARVEERGF